VAKVGIHVESLSLELSGKDKISVDSGAFWWAGHSGRYMRCMCGSPRLGVAQVVSC
jgi:hypothetical protein